VDLEAGRASPPASNKLLSQFTKEFKIKLLSQQGELRARMSEVDHYIDLYMQWRGLEQSKKKKELADAQVLREEMMKIEDTVDHKQIVSVRQAAI